MAFLTFIAHNSCPKAQCTPLISRMQLDAGTGAVRFSGCCIRPANLVLGCECECECEAQGKMHSPLSHTHAHDVNRLLRMERDLYKQFNAAVGWVGMWIEWELFY